LNDKYQRNDNPICHSEADEESYILKISNLNNFDFHRYSVLSDISKISIVTSKLMFR